MLFTVYLAWSTPSQSGKSINGTRAVLGCRSCLGKERNKKSISNRIETENAKVLFWNPNPRSEVAKAGAGKWYLPGTYLATTTVVGVASTRAKRTDRVSRLLAGPPPHRRREGQGRMHHHWATRRSRAHPRVNACVGEGANGGTGHNHPPSHSLDLALLRCWRSGGGKGNKGEGEMTGGLGPVALNPAGPLTLCEQ
jgi:hypothetical protein